MKNKYKSEDEKIKSFLYKWLFVLIIISLVHLGSTIFSIVSTKNQKVYLDLYYKNLEKIEQRIKS